MSMQTEVQVAALRKAVAAIEKRLEHLEEVACSQMDVIPSLRKQLEGFSGEIKGMRMRINKKIFGERFVDDGK